MSGNMGWKRPVLDVSITFRMTKEESDRLLKTAGECNAATLSEFIRLSLLHVIKSEEASR